MAEEKKDESLIPTGGYCYRLKRIEKGEVLNRDIERFGKELRKFPHHGDFKEILCPYWMKTDYGTARYEFLGIEAFDANEDLDMEKIVEKFGTEIERSCIGLGTCTGIRPPSESESQWYFHCQEY
ncbi:MAG: hypothetical protein KDI54_14370 [Gammaproteobacteria bacterium]|nr:hypothetical protein [Gammaproteobacteria bacterium]